MNFNRDKNIQDMSTEEKYDLLNEIEESEEIKEEDLELLKVLSYDQGEEIRTQVAEILGDSDSVTAEDILIRLLQDSSGLVRACSCDSLQYSDSLEVLDLLISLAEKDKTHLVRGYAATSIANILINLDKVEKQYIDFFYDLLNKEKARWVKLNIYKSLYLMGEDSFLNELIENLKHNHFRKRAVTANLLLDLVSDENREEIKFALMEALAKEKTVMVKSIIEKGLANI